MTFRDAHPTPSVDLADRYAELAPRALRGVLASLALVMLAASLDTTAVGTALPRIVSDLRGNELYAWVFTIYLLAMTATMPVWGSLSDRFGRRPVLFAGLVVFLAGSALCGLASDMTQLILFRGPGPTPGGVLVLVRAGVPGRTHHRRRHGRHHRLALGVLRQPADRHRRVGGDGAVHAAPPPRR
jgi:MFS family permease